MHHQTLIADLADTGGLARQVHTRVWRRTLDQPGYALIRFASPIDSLTLRRTMLSLLAAFPEPFVIERLGRFDQQVSSKFHRDGAPDQSMLLLGYEPTPIPSRLWIADVSAAARGEQLSLEMYLSRHNPMFHAGESRLSPFVTELPLPHGEPFVVIINNSQLPFDPAGNNPLGVLHKAVIEIPDPGARRIINSIGATPAGHGPGKSPVEIDDFLATAELDR
jgi:hypothetical protein